MIVERKHFPNIIPDNQEVYFLHLIGVIESRDELAALEITKISSGYHFRISPSLPSYNDALIEAIIALNNTFGIRLDIGKSIKSSGSISFKISM